ncbi:MAG: AraC family transcriptional regulator [Vitreimonas sp.]
MSRAQADIVRAGALWGYCQLTRLLGHDPQPLLTEVGLSESNLDDPDRFLPRPSVAALLDVSAAQLDRPDFGLQLARMQSVDVLGPVAFALRNAPDWGGAVAAIAKYIHRHAAMATITVEPGGPAQEKRIVFRHAVAMAGVQLTEHALGLFCRIGRHLTGDRYRPARVTFMHAPVSSPDVYLEHFGVTPEFGASTFSVSVDECELRLPLKTAIPQLQGIVEGYLEQHAPAPGRNLDRRVHEAVAQLISSNSDATVDDVSSMLHMRARTLQRRLAEEGTTFKKARDGVRKHMAEDYLADDSVPLAYVPDLLGYADQSALNRSCVRWFGMTPLAMREQGAHAHQRSLGG